LGKRSWAATCGAPRDISDKGQARAKWPDGSLLLEWNVAIVDQQVGLQSYAGPGTGTIQTCWKWDGGMSETKYRAHFSLWAILAAPLIAGNDLRDMRPEFMTFSRTKK